jgi:type VI secretion system secreted protein Hcp
MEGAAAMAIDTFLALPTTALPSGAINAEPTLDQYFKGFTGKRVVGIRAFSLGVENPTSIGSVSGGAGAGKVQLKEAFIEKSVDLLSSSLYWIAARGGHLAWMQVFVRKAGGTTATGKPYLVYGFDTVFINKIEWSASEGDELPNERVTFAYGGLALGYYQEKPDGTFLTAKTTTWNQITNQEPVKQESYAGF